MKAAFVRAKVWLNLMLLLKVCIVLYCSAIRVHLYVCRREDKIMAMDAIQGYHKSPCNTAPLFYQGLFKLGVAIMCSIVVHYFGFHFNP